MAWCAPLTHRGERTAGHGPRGGGGDRARSLPHHPLPSPLTATSRSCCCLAVVGASGSRRSIQMPCTASRNRRAAGHGGAEVGRSVRFQVHHTASHAVSPNTCRRRWTGHLPVRVPVYAWMRLPVRAVRRRARWWLRSRCATTTVSARVPQYQIVLRAKYWLLVWARTHARTGDCLIDRSSSAVGRVAVEKNIGAFLDLDLPGSNPVVGVAARSCNVTATRLSRCNVHRPSCMARRWRAYARRTCLCSRALPTFRTGAAGGARLRRPGPPRVPGDRASRRSC